MSIYSFYENFWWVSFWWVNFHHPVVAVKLNNPISSRSHTWLSWRICLRDSLPLSQPFGFLALIFKETFFKGRGGILRFPRHKISLIGMLNPSLFPSLMTNRRIAFFGYWHRNERDGSRQLRGRGRSSFRLYRISNHQKYLPKSDYTFSIKLLWKGRRGEIRKLSSKPSHCALYFQRTIIL